jgi:hypothetical protein
MYDTNLLCHFVFTPINVLDLGGLNVMKDKVFLGLGYSISIEWSVFKIITFFWVHLDNVNKQIVHP